MLYNNCPLHQFSKDSTSASVSEDCTSIHAQKRKQQKCVKELKMSWNLIILVWYNGPLLRSQIEGCKCPFHDPFQSHWSNHSNSLRRISSTICLLHRASLLPYACSVVAGASPVPSALLVSGAPRRRWN